MTATEKAAPIPALKPCPFCGGKAHYVRSAPAWMPNGPFAAGCVEGHATSPDLDTREDAAEWWNRRAKSTRRSRADRPARPTPGVEEAQDALGYIYGIADGMGGTVRSGDLRYQATRIERVLAALPSAESRQEEERIREDGWFLPWDRTPDIGRKFIAVYNDGSGAQMFWRHDCGYIDQDGEEYESLDLIERGFGSWAYLADDIGLWCELRSEDPMMLQLPAARLRGGAGND